MEKLGNITPASPNKQDYLTKKSETVSFSGEAKLAIKNQLSACAIVQRTYGKQGADLEATMRIFFNDLAGFDEKQVIKAIAKWRLKGQTFPTPYDIKQMIEPEFEPDFGIYQRCKKIVERGEGLDKHFKYMRKYEDEKGL